MAELLVTKWAAVSAALILYIFFVIKDFLGNINRSVFAVLESSADVFANNTDGEQLHSTKEKN